MAEMNRIWQETLERLREGRQGEQVDAWLAPLQPLRFDGGALILGAATEFQRSYVARQWQSRLEEAATAAAGRSVTIRFELGAGGQGQLFPATPAAATDREARPAAERPRPTRTRSGDEGGLPLNPKYLFSTFVVGDNNRFGHAAALGVAEKPGRAINPLFIYGGSGLGKSHLLHAIGHAIRQNFPGKRALYTTMEKFTNDMITAIRFQNTPELRRKYRHADLLLIDDIQFLQGKESTQDEFFHTINDLMAGQRQIVMTSDSHPKDIKVEERLKSRFQGGLVADLQAPDVETRTAILKKKTETDGLAVSEEVLGVIAGAVQSNIRELEGALNRVVAMSALTGQPLTADLARSALKDLIAVHRPVRTVDRVQQAVAKHFSLDPQILSEKTRTEAVAYPRQIAMFLCHELLGASSVAIGHRFGGRDHSTVLHAIEKIRRLSDADDATRGHLDQLRRALDV